MQNLNEILQALNIELSDELITWQAIETAIGETYDKAAFDALSEIYHYPKTNSTHQLLNNTDQKLLRQFLRLRHSDNPQYIQELRLSIQDKLELENLHHNLSAAALPDLLNSALETGKSVVYTAQTVSEIYSHPWTAVTKALGSALSWSYSWVWSASASSDESKSTAQPATEDTSSSHSAMRTMMPPVTEQPQLQQSMVTSDDEQKGRKPEQPAPEDTEEQSEQSSFAPA